MTDLLDLQREGEPALTLIAVDILPTRILADAYWTPAPIPAGTIFDTPAGAFRLTRDLDAGLQATGGRSHYDLEQRVELEATR